MHKKDPVKQLLEIDFPSPKLTPETKRKELVKKLRQLICEGYMWIAETVRYLHDRLFIIEIQEMFKNITPDDIARPLSKLFIPLRYVQENHPAFNTCKKITMSSNEILSALQDGVDWSVVEPSFLELTKTNQLCLFEEMKPKLGNFVKSLNELHVPQALMDKYCINPEMADRKA